MDSSEFNAAQLPCDGQAFLPGGSSTSSHFMLEKPGISAGLMGHLVHMQTLPFKYLKVVIATGCISLFQT